MIGFNTLRRQGHQRLLAPWMASRSPPPPPPDSRIPTNPPVSLPPGIQPPSASDADLSFAGFRPVDFSLPLRVDDAFETYRVRKRGWLGHLVRRTDGIRCLPTSTRITNLVRCALSLLPTDPSFWRNGKTKGTGGPPTGYSSSSAKWAAEAQFSQFIFRQGGLHSCILCSMFRISHNYEERVPNVTFCKVIVRFCKVIIRFRIFDVIY